MLLSRDHWRELEEFWAQDMVTSLRRLGMAISHVRPTVDRQFTICHFDLMEEDPGATQPLRRVG